MKKTKLLYQELGLELNEGLRRLMPSRIEYGIQNDFAANFEVTTKTRSSRLVTEEEFAKWRGIRTIGLFGNCSLYVAMQTAERLYPDAGIWAKKDTKRRRF